MSNNKGVDVDKLKETTSQATGAAKALAQGKMPSTNQVSDGIQTFRDADVKGDIQLSKDSEKAMQKVDKALEATQKLINEKNADDNIQKLIHHAKIAAKRIEIKPKEITSEIPDKDKVKNMLEDGYANCVIITKEFVLSNQFRALLHDIYSLFRQIMQNNKIPGAHKLPEDPKDLKYLDKDIKNAARDVKNELAETANELLEKHEGEIQDHKEKATSAIQDAIVKGAQEIKPIIDKAADDKLGEAKDHAGTKFDKTQNKAEEAYRENKEKAKNLADKAKDKGEKYIDQAKTKANEIKDVAQQKASDVIEDLKLTEEQKDALISRVQAISRELKKNPECKKAFESLVRLLENLQFYGEQAIHKVKETSKTEIENNDSFHAAALNAKISIENFSGKKSLDPLMESCYEFARKMKNKQLKPFKELKLFVQKCIKEPQYLNEDKAEDEFYRLVDSIRFEVLDKNKDDVNLIMSEMQEFSKALKDDPTTNEFVKNITDLGKELFMDENGKVTIKYDICNDFLKFLPVLADRLKCINIGTIDIDEDGTQLTLQDFKINFSNILPKFCRVRTDTKFDSKEEKLENITKIKLCGICVKVEETPFSFKTKKMGISIEDAGLLHLDISGDGMDVNLTLKPPVIGTSDKKDNPNITHREGRFRVGKINCHINDMKVKFKYTKHDTLYKVFNPIIKAYIKSEIEEQSETKLRTLLESIDDMANKVQKGEKPVKVNVGMESMKIEDKPLDTRPDGWKSDAFDSNQ